MYESLMGFHVADFREIELDIKTSKSLTQAVAECQS